jgi:hypothetical protein
MGGGGTYFLPRFVSVWKAEAGMQERMRRVGSRALETVLRREFSM